MCRYLGLLELLVSRIDRRPALLEEPFFNLYFLEVARKEVVEEDRGDLESMVNQGIDRVHAEGGKVELIGLW